jgi:phytol kinase
MKLIITVLIVFIVLILSEFRWRRKNVHGEFSRKVVHISIGSFVAFWPFFLSWNDIKFLSLAFLIVISISKYLKVFHSIHSVQRPTFGELYFAISVGVIAFVTADKWIYMTSLLLMSLADGLAAVIGVHYGKNNRYKVFGQTKSIVGTATFCIVALLILVFYSVYAPQVRFQLSFIGLALIATGLENVAIAGLDNLLVPLSAATILSLVH